MTVNRTLLIILLLFNFCCSTQQKKEPETVPVGHVPDNFVDVIDMDEPLPKWANEQFDKFRGEYHRLFQVKPTYLEADFKGDGTKGVAVFINRTSDTKEALYFFLKQLNLLSSEREIPSAPEVIISAGPTNGLYLISQ